MDLCRHCHRKKINRPLGLCWTCYYRPGVRGLYRPKGRYGEAGRRGHGDEPTMAEIEAMIAEQRDNLPAWWAASERQKPKQKPYRIPTVRLVQAGRKELGE